METCITLLGFSASRPQRVSWPRADVTQKLRSGDNISRPLVNAVFCLTVLCLLSGMSSAERHPRRVPGQSVLFASVSDVSGDGSRTRAMHDVHTQETGEIPQVLQNVWVEVSFDRRAVLELVPASGPPRANHLVSIPHSELPLALTQKADALSPLSISVPRYPQLPVTPLAGAGSQVLFSLFMSKPLEPASESSFFLHLLRGVLFLNMGPVALVALGAGAFVTTAAAGAILLRRKLLGKQVEIDLEKGPEIMEQRETGPGWKEFTEVDGKGPYELLMPLVGALSPRETDVTDANGSRASLSPRPQFPTLQQYPDLSAPNPRQQLDPVPVLEGDISDSYAPAFPPGLPVPAKSVAVTTPLPTRLGPISELGPLDTGVAAITSWPVLAPTPVEDMRARANGLGHEEQPKPDITGDVVPPDEPSASSLKLICDPEIAPDDSSGPSSSASAHESEEVDPFADPGDLAHSPCSEDPPDGGGQSVVITLEYSDSVDSVPASPILCADPDATMPDTVFASSISLPESLPPSPTTLPPLPPTFCGLPLDTVASTTVIFGEDLSPSIGVSDPEPSSPVIEPSFVPVLAPIITISCWEDTNEAPHSPLSDAGSSSSDSSGPDTPTELKHDLPFSPVLELSSKPTPGLQLSVCLPPEEGTAIDEDMELVDDFVIVEEQALDPASPTIGIIPPELKTPKLPGGFQDIINESNASLVQKPAVTGAVIGPPLTADMVQLCHAMLAVSNCAGLVAQFVVGFSMWWSLTLVPA
ncbi:unnamed protein product [Rhizoctonia solani]|uniref:Uncharacterized protein n=1 Tax=Rhizoctonia solani TaxID=456999 RepID=A0A8H3HLZ5_9AGAM|nr:unnamed protein product [Rhizoctonia solani]